MTSHLVTGAGSGIGAVLADRLHARGDHLVLLARSPARAADLEARYPGSDVHVVDLADPGAVGAFDGVPDELASVHHVAGVVELATVAEQEDAALRAQLDVNLVAPAVLTRLCLPAVRRTRGTFVFVNSSAGLSASASWSAYAASKFGLRGFADALRAEEVEQGVRVTTVFPSRTATPMQEKVHEQEGRTYDASRWITPETVVDMILHVLDLPGGATIPEVSVRAAVPRTA
ncbi:SDR family oxidoreductase [Nocardioides sp. cx-169]|uniref:SDR family oxidoreductase n=1 Tax=Nocardioides sp. cx-169 TaxID=2899080 RepID=UPI001E4AD653|nr:SDR family oxidoreductase [Nocardioides sp. cx-169]MCD4534384.1 SDR family oxidoreductase [Nocardioides sp. cx-169]